jgi:tRNA dimethylallyltransferase
LDQPKIAIGLDRDSLIERIESRIRHMVAIGWRNEVESLLESGVSTDAPAFRAIGYKTMAECVTGQLEEPEAIEKILIATRQYAKRQLTWLRKEPRLLWVEAKDGTEATASDILNIIRGGSNGKSN